MAVLEKEVIAQSKSISLKRRFLLLPLMFFFILFAYFDRINVAILATDQSFLNHFNLNGNPAAIGFLMTAFLLGYGISGIVLGAAVDRFGPRLSASVLCLVWSLAMIAMGLAGKFSSLLAGRVVLGVAEGPQFAINSKWIKNWFLPGEQATVNSVWLFGSPLGAALGMPFITFLVFGLGWQASFWILGLITLILVTPYLYFIMVDKPEQAGWVSESEVRLIKSRAAAGPEKRFNPAEIKTIVKNSDFWLNTLGVMGEVSFLWGLMMWLPSYLKQSRGMSVTEMGSYSGITFVALALGLFIGSLASDRAMRRAPFCLFGMTGMGLAMLVAALAASNTMAVAFIWIAAFGFGIAMSPMHVIAQNIPAREMVATGYGLWNGIGNLTSAFVPFLMGAIIKSTGDFTYGMFVLVLVALLGSLPYIALTMRRY